jgi:putative ABC transport system substrate-binding protein
VNRRDIMVLVGAWAMIVPFEASAQPAMSVIGVLDGGDPGPLMETLREGLRRLGYAEGRNVRFEVRSTEGRPELLRRLADELVTQKVDLIVTRLTPAAQAAKAATQTIPIIMAPAGAPVQTGLIKIHA